MLSHSQAAWTTLVNFLHSNSMIKASFNEFKRITGNVYEGINLSCYDKELIKPMFQDFSFSVSGESKVGEVRVVRAATSAEWKGKDWIRTKKQKSNKAGLWEGIKSRESIEDDAMRKWQFMDDHSFSTGTSQVAIHINKFLIHKNINTGRILKGFEYDYLRFWIWLNLGST